MANHEEEHPNTIAESGADPGPLQLRVPEHGSQAETPAEPEKLAGELRETVESASTPSKGFQFSSEKRPDTAPEPQETLPGTVPPLSSPARDQLKPRPLFPALAATALVGALLAIGTTFALHYSGLLLINGVAPDERIAALAARLDALEGKEDAASAAARTGLSALESRVAAAESTAAKAEELANSTKAEIAKAMTSAPAAQEPASDSARAEAPDLAPLETRVASLEQRLGSIEPVLSERKAPLSVEPERDNEAIKQVSRAGAIAVVTESLLRKLDSGGQFSSELSALESLGVSQASLAPLRAAPELTVATERQLAAQFAALTPEIIASESTSQTSGTPNLIERLTRDFERLVHIRRVGDPEAAGTQGLLAQIEKALAERDLEAALKVWHGLPSSAMRASQRWGEAAKARLDALNAARSIEAESVAALGKLKS
jgi:hypothetical protein